MIVIGKRPDRGPLDWYRVQQKLDAESRRHKPYAKPRGMVLKFRTWAEHDHFVRTRAARKL